MDRKTHNQIAFALSLVALLASLASIAPLGGAIPSLLALLGFAALVGALHTVRPGPTEYDEDGKAQREGGPATMAGLAASLFVVVLSVLVLAALMARVADVRYLGTAAIIVAEHFTIITGPFAAVLTLGPLLAARGRLTLVGTPEVPRRVASIVVHTLSLGAGLLVAVDVGLPTEPWQAPYLLAISGIMAWVDSLHMAGLPSPGALFRRLERGETAQERLVLRGLAVSGNGAVLLLALSGAALHILGYIGGAAVVELVAILLLLGATYAASTLRSALPLELEEDPQAIRQQQGTLRMLALGPLFVTAAGGLLTLLALLGLFGGAEGIASAASLVRPAVGGLIAVLAGINLVRARMRTHGIAGSARKATWITAASMLAGAGFFSVIIHLDIMTGPIVSSGIVLLFDYLVLLAVSLFVLARWLYPLPWSDMEREKKPAAKESPEDYRKKVERGLWIAYIASGVFVLAAVGLLAAITMGAFEVPLPESSEGRNAAFLSLIGVGLLIILGLVVLFFQSRKVKAPTTEKVQFKKKYTPHEVARLAVLGISGTVAVLLVFLGMLTLFGQLTSFGALELQPKHSTDFFVFGILIGMGPAGFLYNRERKRIKAIDKQLPEFLRDLAESQRTGMTLTQAVITAAKGNYGALTPEIRKMAAQIEWGVSFENALQSFSKRVDTPLVKRTVTLIIEAQNSGGNVIDVLTAAADDAREIQMIDEERKGGMQIYVMIIYIAFMVFIGVIAILNVKFMPEVAKAVSGASGVTVGSITFAEFDIQAFRTLFFHAAIIQGLGGGFVAGSMEEGKPVAGLKHAFAMVIVAYVIFRFLLGG